MAYLRIAETNDIHFDQVEVSSASGMPELRVSGLIFHSAVVAENIRLQSDDHSACILVEMALTHPGKSGSFDVTIPLHPGIERVTFGTSGNELWSRASGITEPLDLAIHA